MKRSNKSNKSRRGLLASLSKFLGIQFLGIQFLGIQFLGIFLSFAFVLSFFITDKVVWAGDKFNSDKLAVLAINQPTFSHLSLAQNFDSEVQNLIESIEARGIKVKEADSDSNSSLNSVPNSSPNKEIWDNESNGNSLKTSKSSNQAEIIKPKSGKDVNEVLDKVQKLQNSQIYQTQSNWIKSHKSELLAKQNQPLPGIDYHKNLPSFKDKNASFKDKKSAQLIQNQEISNQDAIAKLLKNYRLKPDANNSNNPLLPNNYPLMVFVSASIPKNSLKDLMIQTRRVGGVLVFRGLIAGSLKNTQLFLAEIAKDNVAAIIDPRLFSMFRIELVPAFVVVNKNFRDCEEQSCNLTPLHDRISGNITLEYALEQIANGNKKGNASEVAEELLAKLSGNLANNETANNNSVGNFEGFRQ